MLDRKSLKLLKQCKKSTLSIEQIQVIVDDKDYQKYSNRLSKLNLIQSDTKSKENGDSELLGYTITLDGRAYLEERHRRLWGFVLPYVITTIIAIASVIVSAFALCD